MIKDLKLGLLASHGGSNIQAIIDACKTKELDAKPCVIISNNSNSKALERAKYENIPSYHLSSLPHPDPAELDRALVNTLKKHSVTLVVLGGYMKKLGPLTISHFNNRIINIHPSLLPKFGGRGFYGIKVHKSVIESKNKTTGVTIHPVNNEFDQGHIIRQHEIEVDDEDTPDTLSEKVLVIEHKLYPETLQMIASREIDLDNITGKIV